MSAATTWAQLRTLVLDRHDRRRETSAELGMSWMKVKALWAVAEAPLTMRELTEKLVVDKPYTTVLVDDLERRGLVTRSAHATDRRSKVVTVTPIGLKAAVRAAEIMNEPPAAMAALSEDELRALDLIVTKLLASQPG